MYLYGFFQTDVLIAFFILLRWAEAITWENIVPEKRDPRSTKEGFWDAGIKVIFNTTKSRSSDYL